MELRAYKRHLKDTWGVTTWGHLRDALPAILQTALNEVRFTVPTSDSNRARWPDHPLWDLVRHAAAGDLSDLACMVDPSKIDALMKAERDDMLAKQIAGCMLSRAALNGVSEDRLGAYAMACADQIMRDWQGKPEQTRDRLAQARVKYSGVVE